MLEVVPATEAPKSPWGTGQSCVISFRMHVADYWRIREIMERSPNPYDNVGDYLRHLLRTQAFRRR